MSQHASSLLGSMVGSSHKGLTTIITTKKELKVPTLDHFNRCQSKLKAFLSQVDLYYAFNHELFINDTTKVL